MHQKKANSGYRELNLKSGSTAQLAFTGNLAAVGFDNFTHGWQAQPATSGLGREEQRKDLAAVFLRDSLAGIDDIEKDRPLFGIRLKFEDTAVRHRLNGIASQVLEHAFELASIEQYRWQV